MKVPLLFIIQKSLIFRLEHRIALQMIIQKLRHHRTEFRSFSVVKFPTTCSWASADVPWLFIPLVQFRTTLELTTIDKRSPPSSTMSTTKLSIWKDWSKFLLTKYNFPDICGFKLIFFSSMMRLVAVKTFWWRWCFRNSHGTEDCWIVAFSWLYY